MTRLHDRDPEAARQVDNATQALVPFCRQGTLPTDPAHLDTMFVICTSSWRTYAGPKPKGKKLARINAVQKQATLGDCPDDAREWSTPFEKSVLSVWRSYKGTPALTAKRRFLALLRDIDVRLLQVKAYQSAPWGFPTTNKGEQICPYSNAKKGCPRPLIDKYGRSLEHEIDHNESLTDFVKLKEWLDEVATQQRCSLGLHTSITAYMGARFATFFARPECGGFHPHSSTGLHKIVKKALTKQLLALVEIQNNPSNFSRTAQVRQQDRFLALQLYYTSITGHEFTKDVACSRDSHHCNTRRLAEGSNHTHPVVIRTPPTDMSFYDALIQVRRECVRLGVTPMTGPVLSVDHRCRLLQMKVVDFHRKKMLVYESQRRQKWRADIAPHDTTTLNAFSRHHRSECLRGALTAKDMDSVCLLVESGAEPSTEIRGGLFPLMAAVLKRSTSAIQRLLAAGADIDESNSRGMTALMWAVKRDDYAMVDALLDGGANVGVEGCIGWTAMGIASRHGRRDISKLLVETLRRDKIMGEMNADRALNHRSTMNDGLTPVAIAAIHRNEAMVRHLMRLGANPGIKCRRGYVAGENAAKAGWKMLGVWLQETRAFGANGVYTFADVNSETALRLANVRILDAISSGATVEDETKKARQMPSTVDARTTDSRLKIKDSSYQQSGIFDVTSIRLEQMRSSTALTVKVLQEGHAAPDAETSGGHTALISAAYRGLASCVRLLVQEGADPNYSNRNDRTALMAAATAGHKLVVLALLVNGANATWMDIDGKVAGAYASEKGFLELAELLAIAACQGHKAALQWEYDGARREKEDKQRQETEGVLENAGGGKSGIPEADLHEWVVRVTKPREAARLADMKEGARHGKAFVSCVSDERSKGAGSARSGSPRRHQPSTGGRCPKCTLLVPCLHFASLERLKAEFPEGIPDFTWNRRGVKCGRSTPTNTGSGLVNAARSGNDEDTGAWWKLLHQSHRDRSLRAGGRSARGAVEGGATMIE